MSDDIRRMEFALRDKLHDGMRAALSSSPALSVNSKLAVLSTVMMTIAIQHQGDLDRGVAQLREAIDHAVNNLYEAAVKNLYGSEH